MTEPEQTKPLIGDVISQFTYGTPEDFAASIEAARVEQEAMVGYPLMVTSLRQTHTRDLQGRDVYEVFATFAPCNHVPHVGGKKD